VRILAIPQILDFGIRSNMNQQEKDFVIDVVNISAFNNVLEDWCNVKKNSHNRYAGLLKVWFDEDDDGDSHDYKAINPSVIWKSIQSICVDNFEGLDEEVEKRILLANKRLDASILEHEDILAIFSVAFFEEVQ